ncbi:MAG: hypothetical protein ACTSYZ_11035 [Candidatus Helarchaeota archaeon]
MLSDRKKWALVRKQLYVAIKKARSLDEIISILKDWYAELTDSDSEDSIPHINVQINPSVEKASVPSETTSEMFEAPEEFKRENLEEKVELITCPHCGEKIEYTQGTVFCPNCGMPID